MKKTFKIMKSIFGYSFIAASGIFRPDGLGNYLWVDFYKGFATDSRKRFLG